MTKILRPRNCFCLFALFLLFGSILKHLDYLTVFAILDYFDTEKAKRKRKQ